jgi:hypothetical protein
MTGHPLQSPPPAVSEGNPIRAWWQRARAWVVIGLVIVAAALLLAALAARPRAGLLDPRAASPEGSMALAELLRAQGVTVVLAESFEAAQRSADPDATLFITVPDLVPSDGLLRLLSSSAASVLVAPTDTALDGALPQVHQAGHARVENREPACALPAAVAAGSADTGGVTYVAGRGVPSIEAPTPCYPAGGEATLVRTAAGDGTVTVIGTPDPFTNDRLDHAGNAALTMRLLGEHPRLVWYRPSPADARGGNASLVDLLPDGWKWATLQLVIAAGLLALWRARRLGPVVTEPLPVVVRAAEAVEGRGRLYHQIQARDRAADALRSAVRSRLQPRLGLGQATDRVGLVEAVSRRTGWPAADVDRLLYGAAPSDDPALVRLADELDALEREVRRQ